MFTSLAKISLSTQLFGIVQFGLDQATWNVLQTLQVPFSLDKLIPILCFAMFYQISPNFINYEDTCGSHQTKEKKLWL